VLTFYCKKGCRTCQKARDWLDAHGIPYRFVDYTKEPPPEDLVQKIIAEFGEGALRRRHKRFKELKDQGPEAWMEAIREDPGLLIRPILVFEDGRYAVGFDPEYWESLFGDTRSRA